jgi:hypothetical protein
MEIRCNAERKVKSIYPNAEMRYETVNPSGSDWATYYIPKLSCKSIWIGNECLAWGGKFESKLRSRAWKLVQSQMLKKLEN